MVKHADKWLVIIGVVALTLTLPSNIYAYLDPGTGSYVLQMLLAVLFGALFAVKLWWEKIKLFLKYRFSKTHKNQKEEDAS